MLVSFARTLSWDARVDRAGRAFVPVSVMNFAGHCVNTPSNSQPYHGQALRCRKLGTKDWFNFASAVICNSLSNLVFKLAAESTYPSRLTAFQPAFAISGW